MVICKRNYEETCTCEFCLREKARRECEEQQR